MMTKMMMYLHGEDNYEDYDSDDYIMVYIQRFSIYLMTMVFMQWMMVVVEMMMMMKTSMMMKTMTLLYNEYESVQR